MLYGKHANGHQASIEGMLPYKNICEKRRLRARHTTMAANHRGVGRFEPRALVHLER